MKGRLLTAGVTGYFLFFAGLILLLAHFRGARAGAPEQPIALSHPLHTVTIGLDCRHCHTTVEQSSFPGMPAVQVCMDCHREAVRDRPEIRKLAGYWDRQEPIAWTQVNRLPTHVHFTHKRHVRAGVACASCHGDVGYEPRIRQARSLKMGWCIDCHRDRGASTDCCT